MLIGILKELCNWNWNWILDCSVLIDKFHICYSWFGMNNSNWYGYLHLILIQWINVIWLIMHNLHLWFLCFVHLSLLSFQSPFCNLYLDNWHCGCFNFFFPFCLSLVFVLGTQCDNEISTQICLYSSECCALVFLLWLSLLGFLRPWFIDFLTWQLLFSIFFFFFFQSVYLFIWILSFVRLMVMVYLILLFR